MRRWLFPLLLALLAPNALGQLGAELVRAHVERTGGKADALAALQIEGRTLIGGETLPFVIVNQRPNRLRVESGPVSHLVIQVYDGVHPPWLQRKGAADTRPREMGEGDARDFIADADFDGPLLSHVRRGDSVDYAGEDVIGGRRAQKLLLMSRSDDIAFLWLDDETREVVKRLLYRSRQGRRIAIETYYSDFRPVNGVLQPYRIETLADGERLYVMEVDRVVPNPPIGLDAFVRPLAAP